MASVNELNGVSFKHSSRSRLWTIIGDEGEDKVHIQARLKVNSAMAMRRLALFGRGVAHCPDMFVKEDVAAVRLVRLFPGCQIRTTDIRVDFLSSARMPTRQREFIEHLARGF